MAVLAGFGTVIMFLGGIASVGVWLFTTFAFLSSGQLILAIVAFFIPPADLILAFFVSTTLGFIGIGSLAVALAGAALASLND